MGLVKIAEIFPSAIYDKMGYVKQYMVYLFLERKKHCSRMATENVKQDGERLCPRRLQIITDPVRMRWIKCEYNYTISIWIMNNICVFFIKFITLKPHQP